MLKSVARPLAALLAAACLTPVAVAQDAGAAVEVAYETDGKFFTADDTPTYSIAEDGTVDWYTFSGFRRYHAECHVCHGPDGEGSSYAPALKDSALNLGYWEFVAIVAGGKQGAGTDANQVMPAFGTNNNVMCYIDDIYAYLLARGTEELPRGRPAKRADKPDSFVEAEDACMG
ncbi:c-type cytochrome, methanol metabolism-related [Rubrimonas cliftonensis]|uniref:C-type cytochrome, methanol metabolism-related n=1 Tax=Rubrimonas cliftonensis TaxID=89524 RepID=A0A1H4GGU3_9RHOB|nr:c-type cytochrome, methanol metabolism-related [Rubrimonas cliftonensis]SEB07932.1 c-type cytochrome, methanol metabolism-related [Rubrimonas cliftonensis]